MAQTYLQLVNAVLSRLREAEVTSTTTDAYTKLIGTYINDTKRSVEDAWNWSALYTTISITTVSGTSDYALTGAGYRLKIDTVNNTTNQIRLRNVPLSFILAQQQLTTVQTGQSAYYALKAMSGNDVQVVLFPTPNSTSTIKFNCWVPQATLAADATEIVVPSEAVIAGAYARAIVERGEDGGLGSSEAYGLFKGILADQIAIEASRFVEADCFEAV